MMNLKIVTGLMALFILAGATGMATAQDTTKTIEEFGLVLADGS